MKHTLLFLFISLLATAKAENPKTHMLVLGGSGDPAGDSTMFDPSLTSFGDYYKKKQQAGELGEASIAFDGGHSKTDEIKNTQFPNVSRLQNFTAETYQQEIARFKTMIENKTIKPGEQLLVYINTHGGEKDPNGKSHTIATGDAAITNYNTVAGAQSVSVDQVADLQIAASKNGVKLAIVDLSCHSGNTQSLSDDKTCIISATGKNHYAYNGGGFNGTFSGNIKPGENLESIFLKTRKEDTAADYPMISTREGQLISDELYNLFTPYLQYKSSADKLTDELIKAASDPNYACEKEQSYDRLDALLNMIEKSTTVTKKVLFFETKESIVDFDGLKKSLKEYKNIQEDLTAQLKALHVEKLQQKEAVDSANSYSWSELLSSNWEELVRNSQDHIEHDQPLLEADRRTYELNINVFSKAIDARNRILRDNPAIESYKTVVSNFDNGQHKTTKLAENVATLEKKLYDGLYQRFSRNREDSNPCRDFKL